MAAAQETQAARAPASAAAVAAAANAPPGKCQFWMERKRRLCKFDATPGQSYCGNHLYFAEGTGPKRVPCPWDPKGGHTVLEIELEKHKSKCPGYRRLLAERAQSFFSEDLNAGPGPEVEWPAGLQPLPAVAPAPAQQPAAEAAAPGAAAPEQQPSRRKRRGRTATGPALLQAAYAASLGRERFEELLARVEAACEAVCESEPLALAEPPEAAPFLQPGSATPSRPFSAKHAQQQASIVGNMRRQGLLEDAAQVTYVEFGAGKGYLSHMLSLCCPEVHQVALMDCRGFKQKGDRSMRHLALQRLRCDIKDFDVSKVPGLEGGAPWVAVGKHLCGSATDFTLRSCARERQAQLAAQASAPQQAEQRPARGVRGLAVATCCHHRCSWRHFVAQDEMLQLGFSPREFEVIVWMTGWALCGHEVPAGFAGSDCAESDEEAEEERRGQPPQQQAAQVQQQAAQRQAQAQQHGSHKRAREEGSPPAEPRPPGTAAAPSTQAAEVAAADGEANDEWRPQWALPRERKIAIGQSCKRLIDAARVRWLRRQGFAVRAVKYVPSAVSGENRLLLASPTQA